MALERRTNEGEAAKAELEALVTINAARQVQVGGLPAFMYPSCPGLLLVQRLPL